MLLPNYLPHMDSYPLLKTFFDTYGGLPEPEMKQLLDAFNTKHVPKGGTLLVPGQVCDMIFFVRSGCLRLYYTADDVDITVWFSFENNSAIELSSFLSGEPTEYFLEAIEDSEVLFLHKSELDALYTQIPNLHRVIRLFWEDVILNLLQRMTALQMDSAETRYLRLLKQPNYMQRIPQKYLASYIGVTPTSLSRIRRNLR